MFHPSSNEACRSLTFPVICCLIPRPKWLFWPGVHNSFDSRLSVNYQTARVAFPKSMTATGLSTFETLTLRVLCFVLLKFDCPPTAVIAIECILIISNEV